MTAEEIIKRCQTIDEILNLKHLWTLNTDQVKEKH